MLPKRAEAEDIANTAPLYFVGYNSGTLMYTQLKTLFAKKLPKVLIGVATSGKNAPNPMQRQHAPNIEELPLVLPIFGRSMYQMPNRVEGKRGSAEVRTQFM